MSLKHSTYKIKQETFKRLTELANETNTPRNQLIGIAIERLLEQPRSINRRINTPEVEELLAKRKAGTAMKFSIEGDTADDIYRYKVSSGMTNKEVIKQMWRHTRDVI